MNNKILVCCLLVCLCISCSSKQKGSNTNIKKDYFIDLEKKVKGEMSYLDIFKRIELIPLETSNESLINSIDKILRFNGKFYILDKKQHQVLIFNQNGGFEKKINKLGRGPGEYQNIQDIEINRFTNNIEVMEPWGVISVFDTLGNFVEKYRLPPSVRAVHYFIHINKDTIVFYTNSEKNRLTFFSKTQNRLITKYHEIPEWISRNTPLNPSRSPFFLYKDTINFYEVFANNVFYIKGCDLKLKYSWDFGKHNFSYKDLPEGKSVQFYKDFLINSEYAFNFFYNIENEKYIVTSFIFNNRPYSLLLDKKTKTNFLFNQFKKGTAFFGNCFFDKGCYTVMDTRKLKVFIEPEVLDTKSKNIFKNLTIDSNPTIVKYHY